MIIEPAKIIAIDGNRVWLDVVQKTSCGTCKAKSACGHGIANELSAQTKNICLEVEIESHQAKDYSIGDTVNVAYQEAGLLLSAGVMYFLPLLGLLLFAWFAMLLTEQQWLVASAGFLGMALSFLVVKYWLSGLINHKFKPTIQGSLNHFTRPDDTIKLDL